MTKGQASPTSQIGFKTKVQVYGVFNEPFNGPALAIAQNASFVARAFVGDIEETKSILKKAINFKGYAYIDLLCPCVSFNKINTFQWYKENSYYLDEAYQPFDQIEALKLAIKKNKFPLGILYINPDRIPYEENVKIYENDATPLFKRELNKEKLRELIETFR